MDRSASAAKGAGDHPSTLTGRRVALVGKFAGMSQQAARGRIRAAGGVPLPRLDDSADLAVVGERALVLSDSRAVSELLSESARRAAEAGRLEIVSETDLWQRLGLVDDDGDVRRLYTPAMLADLLHVPVAVVRRWHRRGLITPEREVCKLPYFDFQEVATARQLAMLLASGVTPERLERQLMQLRSWLPHVERPLAQLSVIVQGRQILLRDGDGLIDAAGQRRFDFDESERGESQAAASLQLPSQEQAAAIHADPAACDPDELVQRAQLAEDQGQLTVAAELYRAALAAGGPDAKTCFQLAEVLYLLGELPAARERYFMVIELDEDYVEARANLACVLLETGEKELAAAALEGALAHHAEYADAHYLLARTLDELGHEAQAQDHWRSFLRLAPESPWADEARSRLGEESLGHSDDTDPE